MIVSGRPREKYTIELRVMLTKEQKEHLIAIANECGAKPSNVIRWLIEDEFDRGENVKCKVDAGYSKATDTKVSKEAGSKISKSQDAMLTKLVNEYNINRSGLIRMLIDRDYERRFGNGE